MRERFFEAEQMNTKKAVQRDLEDAGKSHPSEWRKALDLETPLDGEEPLKVEKRETRIETKEGKIEDENWQNQLDIAFERGDYALIHTLQRVRQNSAPNSELVRNRLHELIVSRPSRWTETYKSIRSISGAEPDVAVFEAEFGKLFEKYGKEKGVLDDLKNLTQTTRFTPSPEQVQAKYASIIKGEKSYDFREEELFKNVRELTGIKPDASLIHEVIERGDIRRAKELSPLFGVEITSEMIQRAYEISFEKNGSLDIYRMSEIGEKPNPELVEKAYVRIIEKHGERWMDSIKSLEQATGIKSVFTPEQLRPVFEEYFQHGWYGRKGYIGVEHLTELTGIKPPVDLVEKAAIKIVDGGHGYIDQGKAIKESIDRLRESTGVAFEIPESEIQERYQKAISDKKAHVISNLHGAFGIRPSVDKEVARQFMVGLMDETYHNPIPELEKVFGVKFKATKEEIEAKQGEDLEKFRFDNLAKITELTGKEPDKEKVRATLLGLLEKESLYPPHERGNFVDWEKNVQQRFEQFGIALSEEEVVPIYEKFVQNQTIYASDLAKVHKISGIPLPTNLAQEAYQKILSPDYVSYGVSKSKSNYDYGRSSAVSIIFEISGVRPELPAEKIQQYYRSQLESGWGVTREIQKIAEVTGIKPEFDPVDINQLYKQWILSGKEDYIRQVKEVTGIELQLDEETSAHVSQQIEVGIEKVRSGDYEKEEYREKKFDTYSLEQDLRKVSGLTAATGVKPDSERLQSAYSEILVSDPYWATKIEQIVKATGVKPVFSPEQLQAKGHELLEKGALRSFERLQEYGQFTFTPEVVAKIYDALLATNRRYDEYDRKHYYNEDWVDRIKRFKKTTGIAPTETQLAEIFSHISQDSRIARSRYGDRVEETIKFFTENFQTDITSGMVKDVAISYLAHGDVNSMKKFIEKVGVIPEFTDADLLPSIVHLLKEKEFLTLASLKQELKRDALPATEAIVQEAYEFAISQQPLKLELLQTIYELTGHRAALDQSNLDRLYKKTIPGGYLTIDTLKGILKTIETITGAPMPADTLQDTYLRHLIEDRYDTAKHIPLVVSVLQEVYDRPVSAETANKAVEHFVRLGKTREIRLVINYTGITPEIDPTVLREGYKQEVDTLVGIITKGNFRHQPQLYLGADINYLHKLFGVPPDLNLIDSLYTETVQFHGRPEVIHPSTIELLWNNLKENFGSPSPEAIQRMYLDQLATTKV